jgi:hypothetical protein
MKPKNYLFSILRDQRGIVLVVTLMLAALLGAVAATYSMLVRADIQLHGGAAQDRRGFYAAEAGLNLGMTEASNIFKAHNLPTSSDLVEKSITVGKRAALYKLSPVPGYDPCTEGEDENCYTIIPTGEKFAGLRSIPYRYTVSSKSINANGDEEANLGAEFDVHNIPIFQFLAFYTNDLYIMPLPNMTLNGRIHTNGDLRLNSDTVLSIGDAQPDMPFIQVSAGGRIYRGAKKYGANKCNPNTVKIDKLEDLVAPSPDYDPLNLEACGLTTPISKTTLKAFKGSITDQLEAIEVPPLDSIKRGGDGVYWKQADLRIVLNRTAPRLTSFCGGQALPGIGLFPIEIQAADGSRDTARTNTLWNFMCERRGAIFYTDTADDNPASPHAAASYNPDLPNAANPNDMMYRRVGEDTNGNGVINNSDGNTAICPPGPAPWWKPLFCPTYPTLADLPASSWFRDVDYRRGGFKNNRENRWIFMLNVNMRALIDWNEFNGGPLFPINDKSQGGLVFFLSVQGINSDSTQSGYGVRIFDSADLNTSNGTFPPGAADPTGLTVVSDQAIYVEGNYNSKDKYPAAIIGDSLNVLSQGWEVRPPGGLSNDHKTTANLNSINRAVPAVDSPCGGGVCGRFDSVNVNAPNLVINAAFLAGTGPSPDGEGSYEGGLENYPRFHESWIGRMLKIRGSFVSLGPSQHSVNNWACGSGNTCNIYDPPDRPWNYDTDFNLVEKLPPLTPKIVYVQQRLYTRFYQ